MDMRKDSIASLDPARQAAALDLMGYMLGEAMQATDPDEVLTEMSERIRAAGVPLDRATSIVPLLHAEAAASARFWERGKGARSYLFPYNEASGEGYARSPAADAHSTGQWVTLWLPDTPDETYDIVAELKEAGITHYIMAPVFQRTGLASTFSFATASPDGFSPQDFAFRRAVFPALAACQEILTTTRAMNKVLRIYVGEEPRARIIKGDVHRGEVVHIRSAILFADMRSFTELTSEMTAEEAAGLLNAYFDCIVPAVEENGGEVLKFMGDGILAVFRAEGEGQKTCARALEAASAGLAKVAEDPRFEAGVALHFGEVAYGNVGSGMRLDYTVIGRDVNLAARIAALCGAHGQPLLLSEGFHALAGLKGLSLGPQSLKGLRGTQEVFAVPLAG